MTHPVPRETRRRVRAAAWVLCAISLAAACGSDGGAGASATAVSVGARLGSPPAEPSEALVMWSVSSGSPDYLYLWGRANVVGDSFRIDLRGRPPAEAINKYGLGVGLILVAPRSLGLHDGVQSEADEPALDRSSGASERHAIIYTDHDQANAYIDAMSSKATAAELEQARENWLFDFPPGYSCGEGRAPRAGERFDAYMPVDCSEVQVRLGDLEDFEFPNWT